jgi:hypothetical protein
MPRPINTLFGFHRDPCNQILKNPTPGAEGSSDAFWNFPRMRDRFQAHARIKSVDASKFSTDARLTMMFRAS